MQTPYTRPSPSANCKCTYVPLASASSRYAPCPSPLARFPTGKIILQMAFNSRSSLSRSLEGRAIVTFPQIARRSVTDRSVQFLFRRCPVVELATLLKFGQFPPNRALRTCSRTLTSVSFVRRRHNLKLGFAPFAKRLILLKMRVR